MKTLKEFQQSIDLNNKFPNYFNKWIFRTSIFIMILFTIFIYASEGTLSFKYAECDKDTPCVNPFYVCQQQDFENCLIETPKEIKSICDAGSCENKFLQPHEVIGYKPAWYILNYNFIIILIGLSAFLFNHLYYKIKKGVNK